MATRGESSKTATRTLIHSQKSGHNKFPRRYRQVLDAIAITWALRTHLKSPSPPVVPLPRKRLAATVHLTHEYFFFYLFFFFFPTPSILFFLYISRIILIPTNYYQVTPAHRSRCASSISPSPSRASSQLPSVPLPLMSLPVTSLATRRTRTPP
jgi:hypothetical protein